MTDATSDDARDIAVTPAGAVVIVGSTSASLMGFASTGQNDIVVFQY